MPKLPLFELHAALVPSDSLTSRKTSFEETSTAQLEKTSSSSGRLSTGLSALLSPRSRRARDARRSFEADAIKEKNKRFVNRLRHDAVETSQVAVHCGAGTRLLLQDTDNNVIELQVKKPCGEGGFFVSYSVEYTLNDEGPAQKAILLVGKQPEQLVPITEKAWDYSLIQRTIFSRSRILEELKAKEIGFFPKLFHTFVMLDKDSQQPVPVYLMERLKTLDKIVASEPEKVNLFCETLLNQVINQLHRSGFYHGDFTYNNVMRRGECEPVLIDIDRSSFMLEFKLKSLSEDELRQQLKLYLQEGVTAVYTPPSYKKNRTQLIHQYLDESDCSNPPLLQKIIALRHLKDEFGLACVLWELTIGERLIELTDGMNQPLDPEKLSVMRSRMRENADASPNVKAYVVATLDKILTKKG